MLFLQRMVETIEMLVYALVGWISGLTGGSSIVPDRPVMDDA